MYALVYDDSIIIEVLNSGTNPNIQDNCGNTALMIATEMGHLARSAVNPPDLSVRI